jgi:hypothetical protein
VVLAPPGRGELTARRGTRTARRCPTLGVAYLRALTEEPRMRAYAFASFVDDAGVALSIWASQLMMIDVFVDQQARARFMMPTLACFLLGNIVAGPLADRATAVVSSAVGSAKESAGLATWRFRVVAWGRAIETAALGLLVFLLRGGPPTVGRILPYFLVAAFMKTALRPSRLALEVDLLDKQLPQRDASGDLLLDDLGRPLAYKEHLLTFTSIIAFFNVAATLLGLLVGGRLMDLADGALWRICTWDIATNVVFLIVFVLRCRPARGAGADDDLPASLAVGTAVRAATAHGLAGPVLVPFGRSRGWWRRSGSCRSGSWRSWRRSADGACGSSGFGRLLVMRRHDPDHALRPSSRSHRNRLQDLSVRFLDLL